MAKAIFTRLAFQSLKNNTLLHTGFSLGEGLCVLALVGVLSALAIRSAVSIPAHLAVLEPITLSAGPKIEWAVEWAQSGAYPSENPVSQSLSAPEPNLTSGLVDAKGQFAWKRIANITYAETDGAFAFTLDDSNDHVSGQSVSFRPAFAGAGSPTAIVWLCGHKSAPPGFAVVGDDTTTIKNEDLASPCRASMRRDQLEPTKTK